MVVALELRRRCVSQGNDLTALIVDTECGLQCDGSIGDSLIGDLHHAKQADEAMSG